MARDDVVKWPAWRYGPNGEAKIFNEGDKIPKGWVDNPKKVGKKQKGNAPADDDAADRMATIESIRDAGVEIADNASDDEINAALDSLTEKE